MAREQTTADLAGMLKVNMESLTAIQKELGETFDEANRHWMARAKSEAEFASELVTKLARTQSIPDATAVYQEWMGHRMQRLADDSQKCAADCQKLASAWTKAMGSGDLKGST
jgi:hypothetical protein